MGVFSSWSTQSYSFYFAEQPMTLCCFVQYLLNSLSCFQSKHSMMNVAPQWHVCVVLEDSAGSGCNCSVSPK